jgi:hypothetical protein
MMNPTQPRVPMRHHPSSGLYEIESVSARERKGTAGYVMALLLCHAICLSDSSRGYHWEGRSGRCSTADLI